VAFQSQAPVRDLVGKLAAQISVSMGRTKKDQYDNREKSSHYSSAAAADGIITVHEAFAHTIGGVFRLWEKASKHLEIRRPDLIGGLLPDAPNIGLSRLLESS
jgi:hypothetical protein